MAELDVSLVVPTFNMEGHVEALWQALVSTGVVDRVREVLVVDDGSTDGTVAMLERLREAGTPQTAKLRVLPLPVNQNRFRARLEGARAARGARLLFLDARSKPCAGFGDALEEVAASGEPACGVVDIDTARNVFCLYWDRTHRVLFRRYFRELERGIVLTPRNFGAYVKGTSVFLCDRAQWVRVCEGFADHVVLSDDNCVLEALVAHTPIRIDPRLRILWTPREDAKAFLARLWERGPSFVEYHVFTRRTRWFVAWLAGIVAVSAWLALTLALPLAGLVVGAGALAAVAASTALFARGPGELVRLAPLHVASVFVFGVGLLRGTVVNLARLARGELPRLEKPV